MSPFPHSMNFTIYFLSIVLSSVKALKIDTFSSITKTYNTQLQQLGGSIYRVPSDYIDKEKDNSKSKSLNQILLENEHEIGEVS